MTLILRYVTSSAAGTVRKASWFLIILVVAVAVGGYVLVRGERKPVVRYRSAPLVRGELVSAVTATGTINPVVAVQVGSQVSGMITSLHADFNSHVKAGDVVARIDPAPFAARRAQAAATLENARAVQARFRTELAQRKREYERALALVEQQFVSRNDVDVARTAFEGAEAQLAVAEAQVKAAAATLKAADLDLSYTVIRSPVDGIVIARNVEVGQTVAASFATPNLFVIARDLTHMQVDTNVSESDVGGITEGIDAVFTVDAYPGRRFQGRVRQVRNSPIVVQNVVTYNVVVEVANADLALKPGMTATVSIIVARRDRVLKIPNAALRFQPPRPARADRDDGPGVSARPPTPQAAPPEHRGPDEAAQTVRTAWILDPSGHPMPVTLEAGISDGVTTEVLGGPLKEGDQVLVGLDVPRASRDPQALPPGFGSSQRRGSSRERGI